MYAYRNTRFSAKVEDLNCLLVGREGKVRVSFWLWNQYNSGTYDRMGFPKPRVCWQSAACPLCQCSSGTSCHSRLSMIRFDFIREVGELPPPHLQVMCACDASYMYVKPRMRCKWIERMEFCFSDLILVWATSSSQSCVSGTGCVMCLASVWQRRLKHVLIGPKIVDETLPWIGGEKGPQDRMRWLTLLHPEAC